MAPRRPPRPNAATPRASSPTCWSSSSSHRDIFTLGGEYRYQQNYSYDGGQARGLIVSNNIGEFTSDSETCVSCGNAFHHPSFDYALRQPNGYTGDLRSSSFGAFFENKFQPTAKLTVVAGVRYDYFGQPLDSQNRLWNYNVANQGPQPPGRSRHLRRLRLPVRRRAPPSSTPSTVSLRASTPSGKWNCNTGGTFQLPQNKADLTGLFGVAYAPQRQERDPGPRSAAFMTISRPASTRSCCSTAPTPYNVTNPSAIYGENFASNYTSTTCQSGTQCAFGLGSLNVNAANSNPDVATFQNFQAASSANILYERDPNALKTPYNSFSSTPATSTASAAPGQVRLTTRAASASGCRSSTTPTSPTSSTAPRTTSAITTPTSRSSPSRTHRRVQLQLGRPAY